MVSVGWVGGHLVILTVSQLRKKIQWKLKMLWWLVFLVSCPERRTKNKIELVSMTAVPDVGSRWIHDSGASTSTRNLKNGTFKIWSFGFFWNSPKKNAGKLPKLSQCQFQKFLSSLNFTASPIDVLLPPKLRGDPCLTNIADESSSFSAESRSPRQLTRILLNQTRLPKWFSMSFLLTSWQFLI